MRASFSTDSCFDKLSMRGLFQVLTLSLSKGEVGTMQDYPPVIGGKSATSSPARRGVDGPANFWLTATRIADASFSASAKPGPRDRSQSSSPIGRAHV